MVGQERWFFLLATFSIAFISIWTIVEKRMYQQPGLLVAFTLLVNLHILLHWLTPIALQKTSWLVGYILVQAAIIFTTVLMAQSIGMLLGLYLAMIGEVAGMLRELRKVAWGVLFFLGLSVINFGLITDWRSLLGWPLAVLPLTFFVLIYVLLYSRQTEANERALALLADLESANRQLKEYSAQVEDLTITNERQRMARELHDTLSQGLAGLILQLEAADAHLANDRADRARPIIQQVMVNARSTLADARRAIDNLRQEQVVPGTIQEALQQHARHFTETTGLPCNMDIQVPSTMDLPENLFEPVERSTAEALSNIIRHAKASRAQIDLLVDAEELVLRVRDDGVGFEPTRIGRKSGHYGLVGISERARLVGGQVNIESQPGAGTLLILRLPLPPDQA